MAVLKETALAALQEAVPARGMCTSSRSRMGSRRGLRSSRGRRWMETGSRDRQYHRQTRKTPAATAMVAEGVDCSAGAAMVAAKEAAAVARAREATLRPDPAAGTVAMGRR